MATRITKKDNFADLRTLAENANRPDLVEFIDHEIDLLSKKSSSKKPTKTQLANEGLKDAIVDVLSASDEPMTVTALIVASSVSAFGTAEHPITTQKVSALLSQMVDEGRVKRVENKKKTLFTVNA